MARDAYRLPPLHPAGGSGWLELVRDPKFPRRSLFARLGLVKSSRGQRVRRPHAIASRTARRTVRDPCRLQRFCAKWKGMNTAEIIARLRENEAVLRAQGVRHVALFGSRARGDNRPDSDIDILVEIAPDAPVGLFEYVAITQYLADLFPARVEVADRSTLKPLVRPSAEREAVYAF
jgi:uncharacterized protein